MVSQSAANSNPLMYAYDYNSNLKFLIDTGASISVIPSKRFITNKDTPSRIPSLPRGGGLSVSMTLKAMLT